MISDAETESYCFGWLVCESKSFEIIVLTIPWFPHLIQILVRIRRWNVKSKERAYYVTTYNKTSSGSYNFYILQLLREHHNMS